jgi:hypothetical protein
MQINKDWKIESDEMNVILSQRKIRGEKSANPGEEYYEPQGYYPTIPAALRGLVKLEVQGTGLTDLKTVCDKLDKLEIMINNLELPK